MLICRLVNLAHNDKKNEISYFYGMNYLGMGILSKSNIR